MTKKNGNCYGRSLSFGGHRFDNRNGDRAGGEKKEKLSEGEKENKPANIGCIKSSNKKGK